MNEQMQTEIAGFAFYLGNVVGLASRALRDDDELLAFFAARGIPREQLERLLEAGREVAEMFYNDPKPV